MVISNQNTHIVPYWTSDFTLKSGLNQLGIRTVSEQLFTTLLPGLNNVSLRIRYYSFYCWIISKFYEGKYSIEDKDFYPFIRRAELLLALINATLDDHSGIPGINFATDLIAKNGLDCTFSLADGADIGLSGKTYWANAGGVLRQYYGASLEEIGVIGLSNNSSLLYNITRVNNLVNGQSLAESFSQTIGKYGEVFLAIVERGFVTGSELKELNRAFGMKKMPKSPERNLLCDMLMQSDTPASEISATYRRETILYILEYLVSGNLTLNATDFARYMYDKFRDGDHRMTVWGWFAYYLNDNWQYYLTGIFSEILNSLKKRDNIWVPIGALSDELVDNVIDEFGANGETTLEEIVLNMPYRDLRGKNSKYIHSLLHLYQENLEYNEDSEQRFHEIGINSENFCDFVKRTHASMKHSFKSFVKKLLEDIIYRHYRVSFRKMLQTGLQTQKFAFENGNLRFLDSWETTHTSPRIDTMRNFMSDLGLIKYDEETDRLTDFGRELLETCK